MSDQTPSNPFSESIPSPPPLPKKHKCPECGAETKIVKKPKSQPVAWAFIVSGLLLSIVLVGIPLLIMGIDYGCSKDKVRECPNCQWQRIIN